MKYGNIISTKNEINDLIERSFTYSYGVSLSRKNSPIEINDKNGRLEINVYINVKWNLKIQTLIDELNNIIKFNLKTNINVDINKISYFVDNLI